MHLDDLQASYHQVFNFNTCILTYLVQPCSVRLHSDFLGVLCSASKSESAHVAKLQGTLVELALIGQLRSNICHCYGAVKSIKVAVVKDIFS